MKYTILGFKQSELVRFGLDMIDALILRYFVDFKDSGRMDEEEISGETYHWVRYDSIIEDLPILSLKKDSIYRRLKRMTKTDILRHETIRENGVYSYYGIGSNFIQLISDFKTDPSELNTEPCGDKSITLTEINPEQKINLLKDPSTKDINNIYTSVVNYLNEKADKKYRVNSKKTQQLIRGRVKEGFTVEDFYKVIDNKVKEWSSTDMEKYLRPETLFGNKFEGYLNQNNQERDFEEVEGEGLGFSI
ncbi:conserved phage C-terminal domain-containing protein [uncultured Clostridium sp.]|uniref:conserved phage C-terminal domain-containing protein n=1 Tax=uncultured Clostridium sp. TaxID=59620 RepID=UPI0028E7F945|nr:conserved phage C-terminal domain-containing protein [uncultured Clostridium sp.]